MKKSLILIATILFATPNVYVKKFSDANHVKAGGGFSVYELINEKNDPVNPGFSVAYVSLKPEKTTKYHYLISSNQVLYILKGNGILYTKTKTIKLKEKMSIYIAPKEGFYIKSGKEGIKFLSIVSPPWKAGDEVVDKN